MGLRDREPQPLCDAVENTGCRHWNCGIPADGNNVVEARVSPYAGSCAVGFSLYLAHIEAHILGVWCIYCVASLGVIALMSMLVFGTVIVRLVRRRRTAPTP
jgi:hypothetical protein